MPHTTHGKNCQKKAKKRGRLRRNIAREIHNGVGQRLRKWELTKENIFFRLIQRQDNEINERARRTEIT